VFNFNYNDVYIGMDLYTTYKGKLLILKNVYKYEGPITLQYLPYGGIQTVFEGNLVINTRNGFITSEFVIYNGEEMTNEEFISRNSNLVNHILPS